jgi:pimeloyl-ACP methyl ester carboxylesterase
MANGFTSEFVSAPDGLRLHARCIGPRHNGALPVVCLPGLTRTANDFDPLALALADGEHPRRVLALDYRGRGSSDYDHNPGNYTPAVELADVLAVLTALEALPAIFIGTSRGGILTMLLAGQRPTAIAAAILNDIGPVIEQQGLMRIKGYVGKLPQPKDYGEAAVIFRQLFSAQFPRLRDEDWLANAKRSFKGENGRLVPTYDVNLARTLDAVSPDKPPPTLWPQFDALSQVPVMVVRGLLSDLLSAQTVEAMRTRRQWLDVVEVTDQGHAPLLVDDETIGRIGRFIRSVPDRRRAGTVSEPAV